jgi:Ca2+/H+ antiporter, TMEM165/GDT1 family
MPTVESSSSASSITTSQLNLLTESPEANIPEVNVPEANVPEVNIEANPMAEGLQEKASQSFWQRWQAEIKVFTSTFVTIFLAELGDKTQVTTLLMSAESQSPWTVFAGAGAALVLTSLLGVLVGRWLAQRVSAKTLEKAAGMMLLVIAALLVWDVVQG